MKNLLVKDFAAGLAVFLLALASTRFVPKGRGLTVSIFHETKFYSLGTTIAVFLIAMYVICVMANVTYALVRPR